MRSCSVGKGKLESEIDAAAVFFPVAVAGGVRAVATTTNLRHLSDLGRVQMFVVVVVILRLGRQQVGQLHNTTCRYGIAGRNLLRTGRFDADGFSRH